MAAIAAEKALQQALGGTGTEGSQAQGLGIIPGSAASELKEKKMKKN